MRSPCGPVSHPWLLSPITLVNFSSVNLVFIFRCSSPPQNTVYPSCVDLSTLTFSLSSHRHLYNKSFLYLSIYRFITNKNSDNNFKKCFLHSRRMTHTWTRNVVFLEWRLTRNGRSCSYRWLCGRQSELKTRPINECRWCGARLKIKATESTRLTYTTLIGGLEHLKTKTRWEGSLGKDTTRDRTGTTRGVVWSVCGCPVNFPDNHTWGVASLSLFVYYESITRGLQRRLIHREDLYMSIELKFIFTSIKRELKTRPIWLSVRWKTRNERWWIYMPRIHWVSVLGARKKKKKKRSRF